MKPIVYTQRMGRMNEPKAHRKYCIESAHIMQSINNKYVPGEPYRNMDAVAFYIVSNVNIETSGHLQYSKQCHLGFGLILFLFLLFPVSQKNLNLSMQEITMGIKKTIEETFIFRMNLCFLLMTFFSILWFMIQAC